MRDRETAKSRVKLDVCIAFSWRGKRVVLAYGGRAICTPLS